MSTYMPGTIAHIDISAAGRGTVVAIWTGVFWAWVPKDGSGPFEGMSKCHATAPADVRPLVVLDLDDPTLSGNYGARVTNLLDHLRRGTNVAQHLADQIEAQTKPPRIPEPGLWGVVETTFKDGRSRHGWAVRRLTDGGSDWQDGSGDYHRWDDLINPTLIREGVES